MTADHEARPVAAIDCGTNSIRLLIASLGDEGRLIEHDRRLELVRLGQGVDATRRFAPDALERTFAACEKYAAIIANHGCEQTWFVATSAARDVSNRDEFFAGVQRRLGVQPDVIAGDREARLSFAGALTGVPDAVDPVLVIDIGGGSTELVVGANAQVQRAVSLDMGSVRLRERFLHDDPPTADQVHQARAFVARLLDTSGVDLGSASSFVGVAGTATSLAAIHQNLDTYARSAVHGSRLSSEQIAALSEQLLRTPVADIERDTCLPRKRAEVICAGSLICAEIARRAAASDMVVSENDILDGMALVMLGALDA